MVASGANAAVLSLSLQAFAPILFETKLLGANGLVMLDIFVTFSRSPKGFLFMYGCRFEIESSIATQSSKHGNTIHMPDAWEELIHC